jgi:uncharacterized membrane protein YgcG
MLQSLIAQHNQKWGCYLINTDEKPYPLMDLIVSELADPRITVEVAANDKPYENWFSAYDLCDRTVQAIFKRGPPPASTGGAGGRVREGGGGGGGRGGGGSAGGYRWLLMTNGDHRPR